VGFAPAPYDGFASSLVQKVASPGLEGAQVAVLHLHAAVSWLRNSYTILAEPGERITQLQYLLQLSFRTSENTQNRNFVERRKAEAQLPIGLISESLVTENPPLPGTLDPSRLSPATRP